MEATTKTVAMKPVTIYSSAFAEREGGRWETEDGIEVCACPSFPGRSPEREFVAQRLTGGLCAWGPTKEAAAQAVRDEAFEV